MLKRVFLFSCEPGGAEVIIPVARLLADAGDYDVTVAGYGYAIERFSRQGLPCTIIEKIEKGDVSLLHRFSPDIVITSATSIPDNDMSEKYLWHCSRDAGIKTIALLDQWQNYSLRFSGVAEHERLAYLPDAINCIDEIGKKEMIAEGFDSNILYPLGHPYLDGLKQDANKLDSVAIKTLLQLGPEEDVFLFVSEAIEEHFGLGRGYTQYDALQIFIKGINPANNTLIIVKLHPKDDIAKFLHIRAAFHQHRILFISHELTSLECIVISNKVFGMTSIMLIEAYIIGKPVISIQPNLKVSDPLMLSRYGYVPIMRSSGIGSGFFDEAFSIYGRAEKKELEYKFLRKKFLALVDQMIFSSKR